ncbi:MAG: chaperone modulator CbpM [Weeksellaceae bacterium]|nr:chaperone modulator CbpM [Weeksellaceae bacterium]
MAQKYITITEYCSKTGIEETFVLRLIEDGLIAASHEVERIDEALLPEIEKFSRWHYDLGVNLEGLEVMSHLLEKIDAMQQEMLLMQNRLRRFEDF